MLKIQIIVLCSIACMSPVQSASYLGSLIISNKLGDSGLVLRTVEPDLFTPGEVIAANKAFVGLEQEWVLQQQNGTYTISNVAHLFNDITVRPITGHWRHEYNHWHVNATESGPHRVYNTISIQLPGETEKCINNAGVGKQVELSTCDLDWQSASSWYFVQH